MAKYRITAPDGATYEVNAPDGASEADVMAYAQSNFGQKPKAAAQDFAFDPARDMNMGERLAAGVGKAITDVGRGAGQLVGAVSRDDVRESRKLDAPLMGTGAGITGNLAANVGMLAPTALIPGASTVVGAGIIGATAGLLAPSESTKETLGNVALGAAGGAGGQAIANKAPGLLHARVDSAAAQQAGNAQKFAAARSGAKQGYVVPPADLEPGVISEAVSGLSGKIKTAQVASQRNQSVTDRLAREALGLKAGDELTPQVLQGIRGRAAQAYDAVRNSGVVQADQQFFKALDDIAAANAGAQKAFPGLADNGVQALTAKLQQPLFDAGGAVDALKVLRSQADDAFRAGDATLGRANRKAADALEAQLERHLMLRGQPDALQDFRQARELIAKTYTVEKALNSQTGNVSAQSLAKALEKGKPLTGELRTVAEMGAAFPKATQALKEAPKAVSPLDFAVAGGVSAATANPMAALLLGARPVARSVMLSGPVQRRALEQGAAAPVSQAVQQALENQMMQQLLRPVGIAGGVEIAR